jgi:hypothetical protein
MGVRHLKNQERVCMNEELLWEDEDTTNDEQIADVEAEIKREKAFLSRMSHGLDELFM